MLTLTRLRPDCQERGDDMEPITGKQWVVSHWNQYGINLKNSDEMIALLNILQANGENLDTMHNCVCNGHREFMDIFHNGHGWDSDQELYESILDFNHFFTESEFIEWILRRMIDLKEDGYDDPVEEIREWTEGNGDTQIEKTEDGYVVRMWY